MYCRLFCLVCNVALSKELGFDKESGTCSRQVYGLAEQVNRSSGELSLKKDSVMNESHVTSVRMLASSDQL